MVQKISNPNRPDIKIQSSSKKFSDAYIPDDYKKVAKGMEEQFAEYMLTQMNNTIGESDEAGEDSAAQGIYKNMLTSERAKMMTENRGGLGLQQLVLDQVYPRHLRTEENFKNYLKIQEKQRQAFDHKKHQIQRHEAQESKVIAIEERGPSLNKKDEGESTIVKGDRL